MSYVIYIWYMEVWIMSYFHLFSKGIDSIVTKAEQWFDNISDIEAIKWRDCDLTLKWCLDS